MARPPRTALVLSGGGLVGGAWMVGALNAIANETGWDPGSADYVLGTSAGSMIGSLLASVVPPWLLMAVGARGNLEALPAFGESETAPSGTSFYPQWSFPRPVLGSPGLALRSLREPWKYGLAGIIALLPQGMISTEPLKAVVRRVVPTAWAAHPHLWVVAIDYDIGERVVFGRRGAPRADLADAVAASCAIPGFYHPVTIRGRRYIDGGMFSAANLDLLVDSDAELVVCLNSMSSRYRGGLFSPTGPIAARVRGDNRRLIDHESAALKQAGKRVILLEPSADDIRIMGFNYMSRRNLERVVQTAMRTTTEALAGTDIGRQLMALPRGAAQRLRPPDSQASSWPAELCPPQLRSA